MKDSPYRDSQNTKKDKRIRLIIFSAVIVLGIMNILPILTSYLNEKSQSVLLEDLEGEVEDSPYVFEKNTKLLNYLYLPSNLTEDNIDKVNENNFIIDSNDVFVEYVKNLSLDQEELELSIYNSLQFYAFQLEVLVQPRYEISNIHNYIKVDEFNNNKHTFYGLVFPENDKYKYVAFNTYSEDGEKKLSYIYMEFDKDNELIYNPNIEIDKDYHHLLLTHIFQRFEHTVLN